MPSKVLKPVFLTSETERLVACLPAPLDGINTQTQALGIQSIHLVCVRPWILSQELEVEDQKFKVILATYGFLRPASETLSKIKGKSR